MQNKEDIKTVKARSRLLLAEKMEAKKLVVSTRTSTLRKEEALSEEREYDLLNFIDTNEGLDIDQLAKELGWEQKLVSRGISRLEKKKLILIRKERVNEEVQKIFVNRKSGIRDMLNLKEIDQRVLKELDI